MGDFNFSTKTGDGYHLVSSDIASCASCKFPELNGGLFGKMIYRYYKWGLSIAMFDYKRALGCASQFANDLKPYITGSLLYMIEVFHMVVLPLKLKVEPRSQVDVFSLSLIQSLCNLYKWVLHMVLTQLLTGDMYDLTVKIRGYHGNIMKI